MAVTGSSGSVYASVLLDTLKGLYDNKKIDEVGVVFSDNAKANWMLELTRDYDKYPFVFYEKNDFNAPFASGSSKYAAMIICPCSAGTMGRIANGISNDLITRAADVMLKERRKLIVVLRETPLNLIHIKNMETITLAGGIICPAIPSFYSSPTSIESLCKTVTDRVIDLCGIEHKTFRWNEQ